jgi:molybdopterin adenylyltransferase
MTAITTAHLQHSTANQPWSPPLRVGVVTVSDRASTGVYADISGQEIQTFLRELILSPLEFAYTVIPDDQSLIEQTLIRYADTEHCALILTTGGTGPAPRDVTPEAMQTVCTKLLPGFGEQMRAASLRSVPTAILSRQTAGIRGATLLLNLPGKPRAIRECLSVVFPAIPYCLELIDAIPSVQSLSFTESAGVWIPLVP